MLNQNQNYQTITCNEYLLSLFENLFSFLQIEDYETQMQLVSFMKEIIKEICKYEETWKIDFVTQGTTSMIWEIGNKIIKIGKKRRMKEIPYHHRILQPIINNDYFFKDTLVHIEVTQKVFPLSNNMVSTDKMMQIINEFQNDGLYMSDQILENFGTLIYDNYIHFNSVSYLTSPQDSTQILANNANLILPSGEVVLIDVDALEIYDIKKYINYLVKIDYEKNIIQNIYQNYLQDPYYFDKSYLNQDFESLYNESFKKTKRTITR